MTAGQSGPEGPAGGLSPENIRLAKIVLDEGFCTHEQIDRCLYIQSNTNERLSLGQSLLREGFLTSDQYSRVLVLLREGSKKERHTEVVRQAELRLSEGRAFARQGQEDRVLGGIALAEGWVSIEQLKDCVDRSSRSGRPLAESLVLRGYVEHALVQAILARLERSDHTCPSCGATLSVIRLPTPVPIRCPRCRNALA